MVREGGCYIIPARCEEGAGTGAGEQRFLNAMRSAPNVQFILDEARRHEYPPGQQRAFALAKVLAHAQGHSMLCPYSAPVKRRLS